MRSAVVHSNVSTSLSHPTPPPVPKPPPKLPSLPPDVELPRVPTPVPMESTQKKTRVIALGVALLLAFVAVARLIAPLWVGIAFGTVMAFTAQPLFRVLCKRLHKRRALAAVLTTLVTGLGWAVVSAVAIYILSKEAVTIVGVLQQKLDKGSLEGLLGHRGAHVFDVLGISRRVVIDAIHHRVAQTSNDLASAAQVILSITGSAVLGFIIAMMTMYYVMMEWANLAVTVERVLPLDPSHTRLLILEFRNVGRSAMVGSIATALAQGVLAGVGFAIAGVPHAVLWGLLTFVGSFLPAVGTAFVWGPLSLYWIFIAGHPLSGALILAWSILVVVGVCDYVIRPRLVGKNEHPLLTLLALIGGLEVFGLPGLLVGPVLMSLFVAILRIYEREAVMATEKSKATNGEAVEKL